MTVDARIALGLQPMKLESPVNALAQIAQLQAARQQAEAGALDLQSKRQALADDATARRVYSESTDDASLVSGLNRAGLGKQAMGVREKLAELAEKQTQAQRHQMEASKLALGSKRDLLTMVQNPQQMAQWIQAGYADPLTKPLFEQMGPLEQAVANIPSDPATFQTFLQKNAMGFDAFIKDQTTQRGQNMTQQTAREGQQVTMRGQDISASTAIRGQNMTAATAAASRAQADRHFNIHRADDVGGAGAGGIPKNKIPMGYRLAADGQSLEPIPGGPAAMGKALPTKLVGDLGEQAGIADSTERFKDTFKPEYAGKTVLGDTSNVLKRTFGDDTGQSQWWQDYALHESTVRNKLFSASLTASEQGQWQKLTVTPRMDPEQVRQNLARRAEIEKRAIDRMTAGAAAAGYNKEQIEAVTGRPVAPKAATAVPKRGVGRDIHAEVEAILRGK